MTGAPQPRGLSPGRSAGASAHRGRAAGHGWLAPGGELLATFLIELRDRIGEADEHAHAQGVAGEASALNTGAAYAEAMRMRAEGLGRLRFVAKADSKLQAELNRGFGAIKDAESLAAQLERLARVASSAIGHAREEVKALASLKGLAQADVEGFRDTARPWATDAEPVEPVANPATTPG